MGSYCLIVLVLQDENSHGDWLQNNVHVLNTTEPYTKKGSDDMEFGMDMYTLLYLKWITNKALLHSMVPGGSVVKHMPAMQETQVQSLGWEDPLEKEMATHSSILAWEIPWTEKPGGLQSTGSQKESDVIQ